MCGQHQRGGIPFLLEDGFDALLVPPNDPDAMTAAVSRILTEPALAARLSANARKKAEQFDWSIVIPQWERFFNLSNATDKPEIQCRLLSVDDLAQVTCVHRKAFQNSAHQTGQRTAQALLRMANGRTA